MKQLIRLAVILCTALCGLSAFADEEQQGVRLLFLGNSITWHPPAADIGWNGNWGMAASCEENDYVHRVAAAYAAQSGVAPTLRVRSIVAGFEGNGAYVNWTAANDADYQQDLSFQPDVVVIAIGENLGSYDATVFREKFLAYCQGFANLSPKPTMLIRAPFWDNSAVAAIEQAVAEEVGAKFINVGDIGADVSNQAQGLFSDSGVARHPGDKGMKAIAERMLAALAVPRVECRETPLGTTYVLSGSGTFVMPEDGVLLRALVVGGGGSGGWMMGGGGGGGQVQDIDFDSGLEIPKGTVFTFAAGNGGGNRTNVTTIATSSTTAADFDSEVLQGMNGEPSTLKFLGRSYVSAGGGGGGGWNIGNGLDGACGGGGANTGFAGTGTLGGNGGKNPEPGQMRGSGGGGGVGETGDGSKGEDGTAITSGNGGVGIALPDFGAQMTYGAGGGGGGFVNITAGKGGSSSAGNGSASSVGGAGMAGSGSGGGGGGFNSSSVYAGGVGGSGTIILAFRNDTSAPLAITRGLVNVTQPKHGTCYAFCSSGTFTPKEDLVLLHALVVGGGGSGGWMVGGGGGGGGVVSLGYLKDGKKTVLKKGTAYSITVGAGGGNRVAGDLSSSGTSRGSTECVDGLPGEPSSITIGGRVYTAQGGGYGGSWFLWDEGTKKGADGKYVPGGVGACGGGSAEQTGPGAAGTAGGAGGASTNTAAGGGGGMCGAGGDGREVAADNLISGDGGAGFASDITGTTVIYGAGGGGGGQKGESGRNVAAGNAGGASAGAGGYGTVGGDALPNTGSGGGGGGLFKWDTMYRGGNGGSGTVILSVMTVADFDRDIGSRGFIVDGEHTVSKRSKDYVVTLKSSGSLKAFSKLKILRALVVGGGGSGGWMVGGGGGGGEVVEYRPEKGSELRLNKGDACAVTVGAGGGNRVAGDLSSSGTSRGYTECVDGLPGEPSSLTIGGQIYTAQGGGYGGSWFLWDEGTKKGADGKYVPGGVGACGGGSAEQTGPGVAGTAGGAGGASTNTAAGGGGGMCGAGGDGREVAADNLISGDGGAGFASDITGTTVIYGAGGGGGGQKGVSGRNVAAGNAGGASAGAGGYGTVGGDALPNTGSGGGGGGLSGWSTMYRGGNGGDGVVILVVHPEKTGLALILR